MDFLCICLVCDSVCVFKGVRLDSAIWIGSSSTFFGSFIGLPTPTSPFSVLNIPFSGLTVPKLCIARLPAD